MRKIYIQFILLLFVVWTGTLYSCYDDKSTGANHKIAEVVIDTTGSSKTIEYQYGSTFTLSRKVTQPGVENPSFGYEWKINMSESSDTSNYYVLSTEKDLSVVLSNAPSSNPYTLIFKVRDENTELEYFATWKVLVVSGLGEGLVVADTKDGGATSDLTHVQAAGVTDGHSGNDVITRNLYSVANGEAIDGKVTSVCFSSEIVTLPSGSRGYENRLYVNTDKGMFSLDPTSFAVNHPAEELFWVAQPSYVTSSMAHGPQTGFACVINGKFFFFARNSTIGGKFGAAENFLDESIAMGNYMVTEPSTSSVKIGYSSYDEKNGQFCLKESSLAGTPLRVMTESGAFEGNNVKGFECIGAGLGESRDHLYLLREKSTSALFVFRFGKNESSQITAKSKLNVTSCTNIASAVQFAFCSNQEVFYYATSKKIYAAVMGIGGASVAEQDVMNLDASENITGIKVYHQAWYDMQWDDATKTPIPENNRQLIVTTYNSSSKEGKVYLVPITALNSGKLGVPTKVFDGFNEVIAIGTQAR